jgi:hypothetical protein
MVLNNMKRCIVNVSVGPSDSWYHRGSLRLFESLKKVGADNVEIHYSRILQSDQPYMNKIQSLIEAHKAGYTHMLYLDCSLTAMRSLDEIWNYIDTEGYYLAESGFNCAQTSSDKVLEHFGLTTDTVEKWYEAGTCMIGINTTHWKGRKLIEELDMSYIPECVNRIKWPNEEERLLESKDTRFLFNRQDQTVISLIAGKYNMKMMPNEFVWRDEEGYEKNDRHIFRLKGGE